MIGGQDDRQGGESAGVLLGNLPMPYGYPTLGCAPSAIAWASARRASRSNTSSSVADSFRFMISLSSSQPNGPNFIEYSNF